MGVGLSRCAAPALVASTASLAVAVVTLACGGEPPGPEATREATRPAERPEPENEAGERGDATPAVAIPEPPACVDDGDACVQAGGRILYVERVDPDGDGDAHFVTTSADSITAPGISVFDVRTDLRPDPLPGPGDAISVSGPVLEGSYGQRQIEADAVAVTYAR